MLVPITPAGRCCFWTDLAAGVTAAAAILVLLGWTADEAILKSIVPGLVAMNPLTAVCFLLTALALGLCVRRRSRWAPLVGLGCALVVATIGGTRLAAYVLGWNLPLDRLLFASSLGDNRMAPNTALHFVVLGAALLAAPLPRARAAAQLLALAAAGGSSLALVGYAFGAEAFFGVASYIPMALNTAMLLQVTSWGVLAMHPHEGVLGVFSSPAAGGIMARRLLPIAILLPVVLGWLRIRGERLGLYDTEFGVALLVCLTIILFLMAIGWTARALNLADAEREVAQRQLRQAHAELELRVAQRTEELAEVNRDLAQKNQENEMFIYSVSHDLRSPLVNLQGFSNELKMVCDDAARLFEEPELPEALRRRGQSLLGEGVAESLHFIQTAVTRLSTIIDALLRLSRVGRVEFKTQEVDVRATVTRIVESMAGTIGELDATVTIRDLPTAWGDAAAIEQVFANLVGNALKYLDRSRKGFIEIGAVEDSANVARGDSRMNRYYVRDNGLGIPRAHQMKIFQIFQRAHPQMAAGEGMGLAIVKRVVERHGGQVSVESVAGSGSTFYVELPATSTAVRGNRFEPGPSDQRERGSRDGMRSANDSTSGGRPGTCAPRAAELATGGNRQ